LCDFDVDGSVAKNSKKDVEPMAKKKKKKKGKEEETGRI
jgi:hypothetical protein